MTLKSISTSDLHAELMRREKTVAALISRRDKLRRELEELDRELDELGGAPGPARRRTGPAPSAGRGVAWAGEGSGEAGAASVEAAGEGGADAPRPKRTRARNAVSLADALAQSMEIRAVVTPAEAAEMVLRNGYTSTSKNLGMMVSNALARDPRFHRVSRGQYERIA
jgi:hypothetical protein